MRTFNDDFKEVGVFPASALSKRVASALLLVAMWLSLLQSGLGGYEPASSDPHTQTPAGLSHLLAAPQPAIIDRAPTAELTPGHEGSGDPLIVPVFDSRPASWPFLARRYLPPSRAPPRSSASYNFQARAPPVA